MYVGMPNTRSNVSREKPSSKRNVKWIKKQQKPMRSEKQ